MATPSPEPPSCEVIVLTALPVEFEAVMRHLEEVQECVHPSGTIYHQGTFAGTHRTWRVAVAEIGMGGTTAATEAEKAIEVFHPQIALFVGVAGGLKDVRLGDVVVATKVYAYESGKAGTRFEPRPDLGHSSHALEQRARAEAHRNEWLARLEGDIPDPAPQVFIGAIAAGEKVLSSRKSSLARVLTRTYGDALAIEMESHGFLHAVRLNHGVLSLVVRGISDLVDDKTEADASGMQTIAAQHAAAFAFQVLAKFTLPHPGGAPSPSQAARTDVIGDHKQVWKPISYPLLSTLKWLKRRHSPFVTVVLILLSLIFGEASLEIYRATTGNWPGSGLSWHLQHFDSSASLSSVAWSGSQFVAVGNGTILTSPNGHTWIPRANPSAPLYPDVPLPFLGIAWPGSRFVAVGANSTIITSPDGRHWANSNSGPLVELNSVAWSGSLSQFVAVGEAGTIRTSPDGLIWTAQSSESPQGLDGVAWSDSQFVVVGINGTILTSPDRLIWTARNSDTLQKLDGVAWSDSQFVVVGANGTILTSPDGRTWTPQYSGTSQGLDSVTWSGSQFVAVGGGGTILTSPDGSTWATQYSGTLQELYSVTWSGSQFVIVGGGGTILTSS